MGFTGGNFFRCIVRAPAAVVVHQRRRQAVALLRQPAHVDHHHHQHCHDNRNGRPTSPFRERNKSACITGSERARGRENVRGLESAGSRKNLIVGEYIRYGWQARAAAAHFFHKLKHWRGLQAEIGRKASPVLVFHSEFSARLIALPL